MTKRLTTVQIETLIDSVTSVLAAIESDELSLSVAMRHRLEGALVALEAVLGADFSLLDAPDG
jgi:hypothetical protein